MTDNQPVDAYYGSDATSSDEIDLSFLDDSKS